MPTRPTRPRKNEGLKQYIVPLYEKPALRFLSGQPWADVADLIFGPRDVQTHKFFNEDVRQRGYARLAELRQLWPDLRDAIHEAQARYAPGKKPWGARFDRKARRQG